MALKSETAWLKRIKDGIANSGNNYLDGVKATKVNPIDEAIKQRETMVTKWNKATVAGGKWEKNLGLWREKWLTLFTPAVQTKWMDSFTAAEPKIRAAIKDLREHIEKYLPTLPARKGPAENKERMIKNMEEMSKFVKSRTI